jgi:AmmeMemoRadiSam system protein B
MLNSQYSCVDVSKRVFLLGPSHHVHLPNAALSQCTTYETPLGNLSIDTDSAALLYEADDSDQGTQIEG